MIKQHGSPFSSVYHWQTQVKSPETAGVLQLQQKQKGEQKKKKKRKTAAKD